MYGVVKGLWVQEDQGLEEPPEGAGRQGGPRHQGGGPQVSRGQGEQDKGNTDGV